MLSMEAGRGVGMDVVYQAVRDLGGSMNMIHEPNKGVTFHFRLPVTLAVTQALLVRVGSWRFAFRSRSIERLLRMSVKDIERTDGEPGIEVDGVRVPLVFLGSRLEGVNEIPETEFIPVVLVRLADRLAAFAVDEFIDSIDIVSKSAGLQLLSIPEFSGVTVLPDSSIVLILDPESFVERVGEVVYTPELEVEEMGPAGLRRVLVVDDSLVVRRVMQKDLEADGLEVETATDGVHALEVLEKSTCDLALVDIEMPRMNGYELLQHLRDDPRYADLPVIIITSRSGEQHRQRAMELGADGYITKPYDIGQLDRMMRDAVTERQTVH
jgi:chemosensory pili system protein ChpA (sensor histidine kinase/response regulator)